MFITRVGYFILPWSGLMLLSGCSPQEPAYPSEAAVQTYQCGALQVTTKRQDERLQLRFGEQEFLLTPAPSASGSRYVSAEYGAEFWSKGNEAQFSTDKFSLPLCVQQGTLPQQLNARGNEPFWLVNVNQDQALLRTPGDEQLFAPISRQTLNDAAPYSYAIELAATQQLLLDEAICYDSMTGQSFPYTARFKNAEKLWRGCAGDPQRLLTGVSWKDSRATEHVATLTFSSDSRVTGFAGCNYFTGSYTLSAEGLSFSPLAVTKRMCPPAAMDYENRLLQQLTQVNNVKVFADGTLHLRLGNGDYLQFSSYPLDLLAN
ncbi:META domain-containing protein [Pseudidiomarina terrestris]|uniref:META domain-containing protein n=1 Tax=Pseudidiomarina terrestris TaxID=2820060 RepID=A0AAW7QZZ2_9GAMM|nr:MULTISPECIES: META domain-containing protein [unclassified Pseudidiomarina]MDN7125443.1 META domain-containing protein [Pseudidiomarina sp. 1APP75-32.1]MDN7128051.1 META domain-containing protein [Pseudidiomarina sp. 1APR75-33.1]MDN7130201.1 META domain-containing protein [Pseudidiomarina sp. 1APR75-15]MDN7135710.1 META domain-containing protein [Pseudidiomarina sp. 1ASP75-5]MDN7137253.1 META domain-containing protein [Pseudidiomarina sp. 1ASP75-14]